MSSLGTLSIIIVTKNRAALLSKALNALIGQCKRGDEIIIVDASTDDTPKIIAMLSKRLPIKYIRFMPKGYPFFYNEGARQARGNILVFYDDDCIATPTYLQNIRLAHLHNRNSVIQGVTHSIPRGNIYVDLMGAHYKNWLQSMTIQGNMLKAFDSKNASMPRALFWRCNGFSTKMIKGSEDVELGMRMRRNGIHIFFDRSIIAFHHERTTFFEFILQHIRIAQSEVLLDRVVLKSDKLGIFPKNRYALHVSHAMKKEWRYISQGNIVYACLLPLLYIALLCAKVTGYISMQIGKCIPVLKLGCVAIISIIFSLVIGEIGLRYVGYKPISYTWQWAVDGYYMPNSARIYSLAPGKVAAGNPQEHTDRNGFRLNPSDTDQIYAKNSIVMFGDSVVYGYRMNDDQTFPYIAQQYIRAKGSDIHIVNAAIPGYGLDQTYLYIQEVLSKYRPKAIVWNINENDILDANDACLFIPEGNGIYRQVSSLRQTLYIQALMIRSLPSYIRNSDVVNMLFAYIQHGHGRYTLGCTLPYTKSQQIIANGLHKLTYFMTKIEESAKIKHVQVLYTLLPTESYFHPSEASQSNDQLVLLERIRQTVKSHGNTLIDMNDLLANNSFHQISPVRNIDQDVLGVQYAHNAESIFLPIAQDNGYRHLNTEGNALVGRLVAEKIMKTLNTPSGK